MEQQPCIKSVRDIPFGIPFQIHIQGETTVASYTNCLFIVQPCNTTVQPSVIPINVFVTQNEVSLVDEVNNLTSVNEIATDNELNSEHNKLRHRVEEAEQIGDVGSNVETMGNVSVESQQDNSETAVILDVQLTNSTSSDSFHHGKKTIPSEKIKYSQISVDQLETVDCVLYESKCQTGKATERNVSDIKTNTKRQRVKNLQHNTKRIKKMQTETHVADKATEHIEDDDSLLNSQCITHLLKGKDNDSDNQNNSRYVNSYTCRTCEFNIEVKEEMLDHVKQHLALKCMHCGFIAINENVHLNHVNELYCKSRGFVCKVCGVSETSFEKLRTHLGSIHKQPVFTCSICSAGFSNRTLVKNHIADSHMANMIHTDQDRAILQLDEDFAIHENNSKEKAVTDDNNQTLYLGNRTSDKHKKLENETVATCIQLMKLPRKQMRLEDYPDSYTIETVMSFSQMDRGKSDCNNASVLYACKICNGFRIGDKDAMETHLEMHQNGDLSCKSCDFVASSITELRKHTKQEHLKTGCVCEVCGSLMRNQDRLRVHMGNVHNKAVFICEYCSTVENQVGFSSRPGLRHHFLNEHRDKALQCTKCGEFFIGELSLRAHTFQCSGQPKRTQYDCPQCDSSFTMSNSLKRHIRYAHKMERNYKCGLCSFVTFKRETLGNHVKTHLKIHDYKCEQCTFTCVKRDQLKSHMKTHTRERPFKCDQCPYAAAANVQLKGHKAVHSMANSVQCPLCGVVVKDPRSYNLHHNREHKGIQRVSFTSEVT